ncbi:hypothetical protein A5652_06945 [Mycobacterium sp. 1165178.9]|nr:hypothetical protein A5652_06945 [Mycobacterium sp. 1165178.9]
MVRFYHKEAGSKKGLVYFERNMNIQALQAYKDLPDIKKLEKAHDKIQAYLKEYVFNLED